ncbi:hypothetical protein OHB93_02280 [Microbacterium sp. No. 7]|uniref:hypothetical protein n=1 Tax=Microbacterium sp. No. 7 TaxID=1714373 RepID=UPI00300B2B0D
MNAVGPENRDLLSEITSQLGMLGSQFYRNDGMAEGYRFNEHAARGRSIRIKLRRGPVGNPGETFNITSGTATETSEDTALLSELRAAFYIPRDSYYGFLFVERIGGRHAKDLIYQKVVVPVAEATRHTIRLENFAEVEDWRRILSTQQVLRVAEFLRPDSSADASTAHDVFVKVSAEGAGVSSKSEELKEQFLDIVDRRHASYRVLADIAPLEARRKVMGVIKKRDGSEIEALKDAPKSAFSIADRAELEALTLRLDALNSGSDSTVLREELQQVLPVDRDEYQSQRLEVTFGTDRPEKTFIVAGDRVPQLVYEFGGRLIDTDLQNAWDASSGGFLERLGVTVSSAWPLEPTEQVQAGE